MKYIKLFEDWLKEGVTKSEQGFKFDWSQDMPDDVMPLKFKKYRGKTMKFADTETKYTYYHAYEMVKSNHSTSFMTSLKMLDDYIDRRDAEQMINKAVVGFDSIFSASSYDTIVSPVSSSLILTELVQKLRDKSGVANLFSDAFVKAASTDIKLDMDKVDKLPEKTKKQVLREFSKVVDPNKPFKIKEIYSAYRKFYQNFILFNNNEDRTLFNGIAGKRVILVDDYKTSGTTVKEMLRQLSDAGAVEVVVVILIKLG